MKKLSSDTMCVLVRFVRQSAVTNVSTFVGTLTECLALKDHHFNRDRYWNDDEVLMGPKKRLGYYIKAGTFFSKVKIIPTTK